MRGVEKHVTETDKQNGLKMSTARALLFVVPLFFMGVSLLHAGSVVTAEEGKTAVKAKTTTLAGTKPLELKRPLDEEMVAGIDRFCMRELATARAKRDANWNVNYSSPDAFKKTIGAYRTRFRTMIGAVDKRVPTAGLEHVGLVRSLEEKKDDAAKVRVEYFRCRVFEGVTAEGVVIHPAGVPKARVIFLPDPKFSIEYMLGPPTPLPKDEDREYIEQLVGAGCQVVIPCLINRETTYSGTAGIAKTNIPHREWIYRMAFGMGRHIIGYEVQKVSAIIDAFEHADQLLFDEKIAKEKRGDISEKQQRVFDTIEALENPEKPLANPKIAKRAAKSLPVGVIGIGEGGLIAFYAAAADERIDTVLVSGYFDQRENVWKEPIYRNVWGQLAEFGDAEIACLIAPRPLLIFTGAYVPEVSGPPVAKKGERNSAAPGVIETPKIESVQKEFARAKVHYEKLGAADKIFLSKGSFFNGRHFFSSLLGKGNGGRHGVYWDVIPKGYQHGNRLFSPAERQKRQVAELVQFTQKLVRNSAKERVKFWKDADRKSVANWEKSAEWYREYLHEELIGKLPTPTMALNPKSRLVMDEPKFTAYEITVDVYEDIFAGGILLLPKGMKADEKRPVIVCQHGLEGTPMYTITNERKAYFAYSRKLVEMGYIVYAPQNPYRGKDRFRVLQRKSNPIKRSLYSYIIPQHQQTLKWLATLQNVDAKRIAFYGISYGGKTAVRVPNFWVPTDKQPGYCLSICSGDFNEWILKIASNKRRYSYVFYGEYEIWEWNMGHLANYAELASLMTPRPFMVERGHRDGVAPDEWVAFEYAKLRKHYDELGIGDKTEIEFFNGVHEIHLKGTAVFLKKHLQPKWMQ